MSTIRVIAVKEGQLAQAIEIENSLDAMQDFVKGDFLEGYIEVYKPFDDDAAIICNEDGKNLGLPLNRTVEIENVRRDIISGDFFICRAPLESEEFESLTPEQEEKYINMFYYPEEFLVIEGQVVSEKFLPQENKKTTRASR